MFKADGYYYNKQLTKYILHFMAIFQGIQVMTGKTADRDEALMSVPIHYALPDRVVAAILAGNTQNTPLRLPVMSTYMRGLRLDQEHFHGVGVERRQTYVPVGGLVPNDMQVVQQRMPLQLVMDLDLSIYASNTDQHHQITEQFLPLFNPQFTIQLSDGLFDMARMTKVELTNIQWGEGPFPIGQDRRIVQSTHSFSMTIWLETPAEVHRNFVERVKLRIGSIGTDGAMDNFDVIAQLDGQGLEYEDIADVSNLKIDE